MKQFFGYVRVSTAKQGEQGVSLQEQRDAIQRYAERHGLQLAEWFEERETAAKRGRPVFNQVLEHLRQGRAHGIVVHKIDRSARNLKDWADLGELIDRGVEVHFANESLDLHSRGGRLSADIQAVVAADYIRNLREETRKGFYGRIKQGLYPLPAPLGYLDRGKGQMKEIDPVKGPGVRKAFELYASGRHNLDTLVDELHRLGLRNRRGGKITRNGLSVILNNPFYIGLIRLRRTGETFAGSHEQLVSKSTFDRVQQRLAGKVRNRGLVHDFLFRRMLACRTCGYALIGERQKGHTYYRCHTPQCPTTSVREERVEDGVRVSLSPLQFSDDERLYLEVKVHSLKTGWAEEREKQVGALALHAGQLAERLGRLTDAYLDTVIDKQLFEERKAVLLMERRVAEERLVDLKTSRRNLPDQLAEFLELAGSASILYESALPEEKRDLLRIVTSNRVVEQKTIDVVLAQPFREIANRLQNPNGSPKGN